jgi:hypothetical protein
LAVLYQLALLVLVGAQQAVNLVEMAVQQHLVQFL